MLSLREVKATECSQHLAGYGGSRKVDRPLSYLESSLKYRGGRVQQQLQESPAGRVTR